MDISIDHLASQVNDIAVAAGQEILTIYQRDFKVDTKDDNSPVTEADIAANDIIVASLRTITPNIPILSEEGVSIPWDERKQWQTFWLVDPLDGTKEFIKRNGEFTVNIALIHNQQPILGVVYAPVLDKLYYTNTDGAFLLHGGETVKLAALPIPNDEIVKVVGSRSHASPEMALYVSRFTETDIIPVGSSLKFCLIAEGSAHCYPRLGPTCWWDTGAGHAVACAAGAKVVQLDGSPLLYNHQESVLNPFFVVAK
ncbi:3'(2'),5'-bisphosphate nucleotidase CysQ [Moritella viscosa]|uniref:3'(2'),5'-bisphosphate nucleotidase CysQ n=1 Tax=Moritella viscosa TaxID=80854 RepID=A0A090IDC7_9GAMM|nr:3'(2'),5'-bisphosphate nucleotidase CysQ [Moritella viscosa]CED58647.1 3'(2'),5'-bisphosphate nucleotidase CysQ [Moritella viscosa]SGY82911.1 Likely to be PAP (3',5' adenosine diphosphate) 3' phosphatase [Moritella viscosa]SGY83371.1 Likely to be PAP (3',5' adenosine diphosphate) 3' phosphatase [Moritella viscosa]SGY83770.1 Likely to be PAP (3',5' adenosine diphosphate) 3' phosphatase [Moritella viscosa]SGY83947.1 Likely to be PAP (3',5' adenosine diphosphate) 3' phosphatase [Moritella visc